LHSVKTSGNFKSLNISNKLIVYFSSLFCKLVIILDNLFLILTFNIFEFSFNLYFVNKVLVQGLGSLILESKQYVEEINRRREDIHKTLARGGNPNHKVGTIIGNR